MFEFVLYRSLAKARLDELQVLRIIGKSMHNNSRDGLTGFMHMQHGVIFQYLEGHAGPLQRRVAKIAADTRHSDFQILAEGDLDVPLFPTWDMGLVNFRGTQRGEALDASQQAEALKLLEPEEVLAAFADHAGLWEHLSIQPVAAA